MTDLQFALYAFSHASAFAAAIVAFLGWREAIRRHAPREIRDIMEPIITFIMRVLGLIFLLLLANAVHLWRHRP